MKIGLAIASFGLVLSLPLHEIRAIPLPESVARGFLGHFVAKDSEIVDMMDETMRAAFGAAKAAQFADSLVAKGGTFIGLGESKIETKDDYSVVLIRGNYEKMSLDFKVTVDQKGLVAGFFVSNLAPKAEWTLPPYAKAGVWKDEEVEVGAAGWPLKGTLSIPSGKEPFPAVLLVQGSGPSDRDEAVGPNKIFADIAAGLATDGIAVLRYDKRTLVYASEMAKSAETIGVGEETVDDAVAALAFLAKDGRIDGKHIFIIGHSLGAMLGPKIAAEAQARGIAIAGLVLLAPSASPLEDVIVDQFNYLAKSGAGGEDLGAAELSRIEAAAERVKALTSLPSQEDPAPALLPLGIPASWWRSIAGYDPVKAARELALPLLVIHGSRDYQVGLAEAALWKKGLSGIKTAKVVLIDGLNHLMMKGKGPSTPSEYDKPGHVDGRVIGQIAGFLFTR